MGLGCSWPFHDITLFSDRGTASHRADETAAASAPSDSV